VLLRRGLLQICCHPQMGGAATGQGRVGSAAPPKTMDEVLKDLVERDRDEAEEAQRRLLAACNGLAGLAILSGNQVEAVTQYRQVLTASQTHQGLCDVDSLQQIHALVNLGAPLPH
jgi:hypothetical protein